MGQAPDSDNAICSRQSGGNAEPFFITLLKAASAAGIHLHAVGEELAIRAPGGAFPGVVGALGAQRAVMVSMLTTRQGRPHARGVVHRLR